MLISPGWMLVLPLLGSLGVWLLGRRSGGRLWPLATTAAVAPALIVLSLLRQWPALQSGSLWVAHADWVPSLGLAVAFRLDALSGLFTLLITGIGLLVLLYACVYFRQSPASGRRFYLLIPFFMTAMLGIVLSENLLLMLVFWELTSLVSFLLIGFYPGQPAARRGARMALLITGGGGLALLGGVLLLGDMAGTFQLSGILLQGETVRAAPAYPVMLALVAVGALTKSAQVPFHLWLPHAMAAPTPVSAYLHSATMVKAGLFLLARLHPALGGSDAWFWLFTLVGGATFMVGAFVAMFMNDMKGLLAYSTVSHLGLIMLLIGLGTEMALAAALFHLVCHALFKAPLFMMAGLVDQATGTRDLRRINGLWRWMPGLMGLTAVAAGAMAGLPLMSGYYSKKLLFSQALVVDMPGWISLLLPFWVTLAGLFSVAYAIRIFHNVFFNGAPRGLPHWPLRLPLVWGLLPLAVLAVLTLGVGFYPQWVYDHLVAAAAQSAVGLPLPGPDLKAIAHAVWPSRMGNMALLGGLVFYLARQPLFAVYARMPAVDAKESFDALVWRATQGARYLVYQLENGSLQRYLALILSFVVALLAWHAGDFRDWQGSLALTPVRPTVVFGAAMLCASALGVAFFHRRRLVALLLVGVTGLFVTLSFAWFSAPDLALTQLSVEVMAVVIMMLALSFLPQKAPRESHWLRVARDLAVAVALGLVVAGFAFGVLTRPSAPISEYFLANSLPVGGGHNVVNVILVDFRGFDTLGEITVLGIAAVAVFAFTRDLHLKDRVAQSGDDQGIAEPYPVVLRVVARAILPIALLVSGYIFLRGHNAPGGGFIAGLITAGALTLQYMAGGLAWAQQRMRTAFRPLIGAGLLLALATGAGSWLFGAPFLTTAFGHWHLPVLGDIEWATAMAFDLGVFSTVVGATLLILANLGKLMTVSGPGREVG